MLSGAAGFSQHAPPVTNFKSSEYKAHNQNWAITQDSDQVMHFANTSGLISYNGVEWKLNRLNTNKIVRSVCADKDRVYTGAYGEIGYWMYDICGNYVYNSLNSLVPKNYINKEEIWHIVAHKGQIYFQSFAVLLCFDGKIITRIDLPGSIMFLYQAGDKLLIQSLQNGIYEIDSDNKVRQIDTGFFDNKIVSSIVGLDSTNSYLIATHTHGIFIFENGEIRPWNQAFNEYFIDNQVNKLIKTSNGDIVVGTIRDGLLIFKMNGVLVYKINTNNGLQNNTILSLYEDNQQNIWVGMDKGIAIVHLKAEYMEFLDVGGKIGNVYCAATNDSIFYVGTNQGLYFYNQNKKVNPSQNTDFKLIKGTQGQIWHLTKVRDGILCGHNDGTFFIKNTTAKKISDVTGGWFTHFLPQSDQLAIIQGTYTGLVVFKYKNGWEFSHKINNYNQPTNKIVFENDHNIWVAGPNNGLYKLTLDDKFTTVISSLKIGEQHGLLRADNVDLYNDASGKIAVFYLDAHYVLDGDKFVKKELTNHQFLMRQLTDRQIFRVYDDSLVSQIKDKTISFPFVLQRDYNNISMLQDDKFVLSLNDGYVILQQQDSNKNQQESKLVLDRIISSTGECLVFDNDNMATLKYTQNSFKIYFHQTRYSPKKRFQYRIKQLDNQWQDMKDLPYIPMNNLSAGHYTFEIKGSGITTFSIIVAQPWYLSLWAMATYILMIFGIYHLINKYFDKKLENEKSALAAENARIIHEHKIEVENDRLISENLLKSKELANATLHLVQKNELLDDIKSELVEIRKTGDHTLTGKDFQNMMKKINENLTVQDDKNLFESNFEDVHKAFFQKLKTTYPQLTAADLKLCAFIKMNLSSKDIAPIFNISVRGLENKRYRLRRKLALLNDANLYDFFVGV